MKPRVLRLGSDKNGDIRVGLLPERKEILISGSCLAGFPLLDTGLGEHEVELGGGFAVPAARPDRLLHAESWMLRGPIVSNGRRLPKFVLRRPA